MKERKTLIITDKLIIAFTADEALTNKDLIDRLNSGEIIIEAIRGVSGADNERHWMHIDGELLGRAAVKYAGAHVRKFVVEKGQSHLRNTIFTNLPAWKDRALGKKLTAPIAQHIEKKIDLKKAGDDAMRELMLIEVDKYMNGLKDIAEMGAMWKFMRYLKRQP